MHQSSLVEKRVKETLRQIDADIEIWQED